MVKIYYDTRFNSKTGLYPIKFRVLYAKKTFLIPSGIYLLEEQFDKSKPLGLQVVNHPQSQKINNLLKLKSYKIEERLIEFEMLGGIEDVPIPKMRLLLSGEEEDIEDEKITFNAHLRKYITECRKKNTKSTYQYTLNLIDEYSKKELMFEDINLVWLKNFERHLSGFLKVNSTSIILRNIRTIFNNAIDEDVVSQSLYPFRRFKIRTEATPKRSLTIEELRTLMNYKVEPHQEKYRDVFMLCFYLIGINPIDLLENARLVKGRIEYRRAKTNKFYSILAEPRALAIIEKYKGTEKLLSLGEGRADYTSFAKRCNMELQKIGECSHVGRHNKKEYHSVFPDITLYWARHTWATVASKIDVPKDTISEALGHEVGSKVTSIYIDYDKSKIDDANRQVLDCLL